MKNFLSDKGFSVLELITIVGVLSILVMFIFPNMTNLINQAEQVRNDINNKMNFAPNGIYAGFSQSVFHLNNKEIKVAGLNIDGQLAAGTNDNVLIPQAISISDVKQVAVGGSHILVLLKNGNVYVSGDNSIGQLGLDSSITATNKLTNIGLNDIYQVAAGNDFSMFLRRDGMVLGSGQNNRGQLGVVGDTTTKYTPVPASISGVKY
ncbi:MAG: hypothetical protein ACOCP8_07115, partial [archaeon]